MIITPSRFTSVIFSTGPLGIRRRRPIHCPRWRGGAGASQRYNRTCRPPTRGSPWTRPSVITGNQAAATAAKLARVQVIAAYPITPQSPGRRDALRVGRVRRAARRVRHRRERALGADGLHRRVDRRRAHVHRDERQRARLHDRAGLVGRGRAAAHRHVRREPRHGGAVERAQRPAGLDVGARRRLDPALLPRQPGDPRHDAAGVPDRRAAPPARHGLLRRLPAVAHGHAGGHPVVRDGGRVPARRTSRSPSWTPRTRATSARS